jgi:hypothetical protein
MGTRRAGEDQFRQSLIDEVDEVDQLGDNLSKGEQGQYLGDECSWDTGLKLSDLRSTTVAVEERKARNQLEKLCRSLEEQLAAKTRELESAEAEIARLGFHRSDLKEKLKEANAEIFRVDGCDKELQGGLTEAKREAESLKSTVTATKVELGRVSQNNSMLQKDIKALNLRAELLKPLVDIGVATRLRFLQHARRNIHRHRISDQDATVIKNGNVAAHGGNGIADAAMFKAYLVPKFHILAQVFKDLYHCNPAEYIDQNEIKMLRRMLDCEATITTVKKNNKLKESAALRKEHYHLLEKLYDAQTKSRSITAWEENQQNKLWLERLEELTAEIVRLDIKSGPRGEKIPAVSPSIPFQQKMVLIWSRLLAILTATGMRSIRLKTTTKTAMMRMTMLIMLQLIDFSKIAR